MTLPCSWEGSTGREESQAGGHLLHTCAGHVAKILTPPPPKPSRNTETELEEIEKETETQQDSASRTVPPFLRNRERFYILLKILLFYFFFCKITKPPQLDQATQELGL